MVDWFLRSVVRTVSAACPGMEKTSKGKRLKFHLILILTLFDIYWSSSQNFSGKVGWLLPISITNDLTTYTRVSSRLTLLKPLTLFVTFITLLSPTNLHFGYFWLCIQLADEFYLPEKALHQICQTHFTEMRNNLWINLVLKFFSSKNAINVTSIINYLLCLNL